MLQEILNNEPLAAFLAFFVVLIPLIIVHELGHFLAGKAVGIAILEFGIGFPPRLFKLFKWGETDFTINVIPLGGFVRPLGEDMVRPVSDAETDKQREVLEQAADSKTKRSLKAVHEASPIQRIIFMASGALANFLLAFLLFFVMALTSGVPAIVGNAVQITHLSDDSPLYEAGLRANDVITQVNNAYFQAEDELLSLLQEGGMVTLIRLDNQGEITIDIPALDAGDILGAVLVTGVEPGSPADTEAGFQLGDRILRVNGEPTENLDDLRRLVDANAGVEIRVDIERGESIATLLVTPRLNPPQGQGPLGIQIQNVSIVKALDLTFFSGAQRELQRLSVSESAQYSVQRIVEVIVMTVRLPLEVISGAIEPDLARPVSVVGMSQIGAQLIRDSVEQGALTPIIEFIALISVALGFFNLLPIPALDGGRILFVLIEIVRRRPIPPEREGMVHLIGLILLLSLSLLIIANDIQNPILQNIPR